MKNPIFAALIAFLVISAGRPAAAQVSIPSLISQGRIVEARRQLEDQNPSPLERRFFDGQLLKASGDLSAAIAVFERILAADPGFLNARRELAHTLLLQKSWTAARKEFIRLLDRDRNPRMRDGYRQFLRVIDASKPFGISPVFAAEPSTNVNQGASGSQFSTSLGALSIDPNNQAQSGIGLTFGASGFLRQQADPVQQFRLDWRLTRTVFDRPGLDRTDASLALSSTWRLGQHTPTVGVFANTSIRADTGSNDQFGFFLRNRVALSPTAALTSGITYGTRQYPDRNGEDGSFGSLAFGYQVKKPDGTAWHIGATFDQSKPEALHQRYKGLAISIGRGLDFESIGTFEAGFSIGFRGFEADFPLTTAPREDVYGSLTLSLTPENFSVFGLRPKFSCSTKATRSNVALYESKGTSCGINVIEQF